VRLFRQRYAFCVLHFFPCKAGSDVLSAKVGCEAYLGDADGDSAAYGLVSSVFGQADDRDGGKRGDYPLLRGI